MANNVAHPPETLEGWYALHQIYTCDSARTGQGDTQPVEQLAARIATSKGPASPEHGWSAAVRLIGSLADVMVIHFRQDLDSIASAQDETARQVGDLGLTQVYSFLSVTEAGLYHLTAKLAQETSARGGAIGDPEWTAALTERVAAEKGSDHVRRRLYPARPAGMPYVCFYPMSKRRDAGQNWYTLSLDERSRLMHAHGTTGRRYAGRVQQVITGAIGFETWEWGVTLFAKDPLDIKKLVTDMRFDEVSARYAEFGDFFVGRLVGGETAL